MAHGEGAAGYFVDVFEKVFGPMQPDERRLFVRVALPGIVLFLVGSGLAIAGDATKTPVLMAVGFPILGVGFIGWAVVGYRLTFKASPALKAWNKARMEGPAANKFNTAVCSVLVFFGIGQLVADPSPFSVVFAIGTIGMLVTFVRRGWPDRRA